MTEPVDSKDAFDEETLEYVTPHALNINPTLIGQPLAKPWKRGVAILIDLVVITILSGIHWVFLAIGFSYLFYYLSKKRNDTGSIFPSLINPRVRRVIRWIFGLCALGVFLSVLLTGLVLLTQSDKIAELIPEGYQIDKMVSLKGVMTEYEEKLGSSDCDSPECWDALYSEFELRILELELAADLESGMLDSFRGRIAGEQVRELPGQEELIQVAPEMTSPTYSLLGWGKGIMNDLGLGVGWSALYFTLLVSWGKGQTLGKAVMRLRVVQINATPISLWDSFGRFGGYAAGFTTGLLGFLQIYWDPNRQAIQDKVSATVVVDLSQKAR